MRTENDKPLYNSRIIDLYLKLVRKRYSFVSIPALLRHAGMHTYEVADPGHWFTQGQIDRFHEQLVKQTGNETIAREAGAYAASPEAAGVFSSLVIGTIGPARAFELMQKVAGNLTRSALYESRRLAANRVEITVTPYAGVSERPFQCENRIGIFESLLAMFNNNLEAIEHPECLSKGDKVCRYILSWDYTVASRLRMARNFLAVALSVLTLISLFLNPLFTILAVLPFSVVAVLLMSFATELCEKNELKAAFTRLRDPADKLQEQIQVNYNNALISNEIGEILGKQTDINEILGSVLETLEKRMGYSRGMILLPDIGRKRLNFRAGFGFSAEELDLLRRTDFSLGNDGTQGVFARSFLQQKPFLIEDIAEREGPLPKATIDFARQVNTQSFFCCPMICDAEPIGVLAVDNAGTKRRLLQTDARLLTGIAPVIGISIRNAELMETKVQQFRSIVELEQIRDELTAAKERSERYAEELNLVNEEIKNFTSIVSHDLRAPLISIKGFATELRESVKEVTTLVNGHLQAFTEGERKNLATLISEDMPECLQFIGASIERMDRLINNVLTLSRLGRKELRPEPVDMKGVVTAILDSLAHQVEQHRVTVTIGELPVIVVDKVSIEQIIGNLLDNALKYLKTDHQGEINVAAERVGEECIFLVRDNGRGIAKEDLGKVFDLFRRAGKQDVPGEGLGLAHVKTLVGRLGGRIWCESVPGVGSTFSFAIPQEVVSQNAERDVRATVCSGTVQ